MGWNPKASVKAVRRRSNNCGPLQGLMLDAKCLELDLRSWFLMLLSLAAFQLVVVADAKPQTSAALARRFETPLRTITVSSARKRERLNALDIEVT